MIGTQIDEHVPVVAYFLVDRWVFHDSWVSQETPIQLKMVAPDVIFSPSETYVDHGGW